MILIYSTLIDPSTNCVIDWLNFYNKTWYRVNIKEDLVQKEMLLKINDHGLNQDFTLNNQKLNINEIESVWFRRTPSNSLISFISRIPEDLKDVLNKNAQSELSSLNEYIFFTLKNKYSLGNSRIFNLNKLAQLEIAMKFGVKIPQTIVTNNKADLLNFYKKNKKIIIKPIQNSLYNSFNGKTFSTYTEVLKKSSINGLNSIFKPCLVQCNVEKKYEIRSFFISGKFYSMAIFSQSSHQTSIDFRKYNLKKPNRIVPYKLPKSLEIKLRLFMKYFQLNTGSFDLIYTSQGEYVFLELNPVGQFGMVSYPCNYNLEKQIAKNLIRKK